MPVAAVLVCSFSYSLLEEGIEAQHLLVMLQPSWCDPWPLHVLLNTWNVINRGTCTWHHLAGFQAPTWLAEHRRNPDYLVSRYTSIEVINWPVSAVVQRALLVVPAGGIWRLRAQSEQAGHG
jgi:hypothetical protein